MKIQKPDRLVGQILLALGIIMILIPIIWSIIILAGTVSFPIYVSTPVVNGTDSNADLARVWADAFPLYNTVPTFLLFVVLVYAGSVFMGKGVGLIKEINWTLSGTTRATEKTEPEKNQEPEPKAPKRARKEATEK
jgi:predicted membrane protein